MKNAILENIKIAAARDEKRRKDQRYLRVMGFLTRKGFLTANKDFEKFKHGKLHVADAIWAGKNLEPRILEVLPVTVARLPKEVVICDEYLEEFKAITTALLNHEESGPNFMGIPYEKYKVWMNLNLKDKRTKPAHQKKLMRSFRLSPSAIECLDEKIKKTGQSGADIIEALILGS